MPIYTKRGDKGKTDLHSGERVTKSSARIEALGTLDELNSVVGKAISVLDEPDIEEFLVEVQEHLHICQTDVANVGSEKHPRIAEEQTHWLEEIVDRLEEELPELRKFILQGGIPPASELYHARAVCRRAERRLVELASKEEVNEGVLKYVNRLSDFLFVLARTANHRQDVEERHPSYRR